MTASISPSISISISTSPATSLFDRDVQCMMAGDLLRDLHCLQSNRDAIWGKEAVDRRIEEIKAEIAARTKYIVKDTSTPSSCAP